MNDNQENKYIKDVDRAKEALLPKIETQLSKSKMQECYMIAHEIVRFGVSQRQLLQIIYLLAREFENPNVMTSLMDAANACRPKLSLSATDGIEEEKLVLPSSSDLHIA